MYSPTRSSPGKRGGPQAFAYLVDFVETNEPRMIAFHMYLDQDGNTLSIVQVHPDSASMEFHMQVNAKHFATAFDWLDTPWASSTSGRSRTRWPLSWRSGIRNVHTLAGPRSRVHPLHRAMNLGKPQAGPWTGQPEIR